jgi:hypothetical protein
MYLFIWGLHEIYLALSLLGNVDLCGGSVIWSAWNTSVYYAYTSYVFSLQIMWFFGIDNNNFSLKWECIVFSAREELVFKYISLNFAIQEGTNILVRNVIP